MDIQSLTKEIKVICISQLQDQVLSFPPKLKLETQAAHVAEDNPWDSFKSQLWKNQARIREVLR